MKRIVRSSSPPWSASNKRLVLLILLLLLALALYRFRLLLLPLSMAMILAYLIDPLVNQLTKRTPLTRNMSIGVIYLLLVAALVSIPVSTISPIVTQVTNFIHRPPQYISDIGEFFRDPIVIADDIVIPVDQLSLDQLFTTVSSNLVEVVQTLGGQTLSIFGSLASATISTVGWTPGEQFNRWVRPMTDVVSRHHAGSLARQPLPPTRFSERNPILLPGSRGSGDEPRSHRFQVPHLRIPVHRP